MRIRGDVGLVIEGGGMRGVFTSGVLDAFMKYDLYFNYVVAVSAGACNGMSYISRQPRRARISNIDMLVKYNYLGLKQLIFKGNIFDPELLYDRFPNELVPFDYDTFFLHSKGYEMVVTNALSGRAEYLSEYSDRQRVINIVQASSSLPYVSRLVEVDGIPMLDGGIVDSIPIMRAVNTGHKKNVVIMTRNKGYRTKGKDHNLPSFVYAPYPNLRKALSQRISVYNAQLALVEQMEKKGEVEIIRPLKPMKVERLTKDALKLEDLYEEGYLLGCEFCEKRK